MLYQSIVGKISLDPVARVWVSRFHMFLPVRRPRTPFGAFIEISELIYHGTVNSVRKTHGNAAMSIGINMVQAALFVGFFVLMFEVMGARRMAIRGSFMLYLMSGIFIYMAHLRAVQAVMGASGPTSAEMRHAPMNTAIAMITAAIGALYLITLTLLIMLLLYYVLVEPFTILHPFYAYCMVLIGWFTGCCAGVVFYALRPWAPRTIQMVSMIYIRVNMIASGKMFVANALPAKMLALFSWNPLFHTIDQARGFIFINYFPRVTSMFYPIYFGLTLLMIGLMIEFYTRRRASLSWGARG